MKKITSLTLGFSFLIMSYTGIMLYIAPHGRIARWMDWHLLGLDKDQYAALHITSMIVFLIFGILHIYYNWKPIISYLKDKSKKISFTTKEFVIALLINIVFVVGTLAQVQPFQGVLDIGEDIKKSWAQEDQMKAPPNYLGKKSLSELDSTGYIDLDEAIEILERKGFDDIEFDITMKEIANELDTDPTEVYKLIAK